MQSSERLLAHSNSVMERYFPYIRHGLERAFVERNVFSPSPNFPKTSIGNIAFETSYCLACKKAIINATMKDAGVYPVENFCVGCVGWATKFLAGKTHA